jgi:hypothetical protein
VINLPDVTLVAYSSIAVPETIEALKISSKNINFADVKIVSHEKPENLPSSIKFEEGRQIKDIMDFNHYLYSEFEKHVDTTYMLIVQYHGYVTDYKCWSDEFLNYDYIGAPWPIRKNSYNANDGTISRVGNGGFSLRSKYLLGIPKKYNIPLTQEQGYFNEDGNICCYHKKEFLKLGIKYAPIEVAARFSYETPVDENYKVKTFGFHRVRNPC